MTGFETARALLSAFKGDAYLHGPDVLSQVGEVTAGLGRRAVLVRDAFPGSAAFVSTIQQALASAGVALLAQVDGAAPNAPLEDLARIRAELERLQPDVVVSFGGGSTIDATKAAIVLSILGGEIGQYFGTGLVTQALEASGKRLTPHVAIQTAASSGAHLTKYSNITNVATGQKKLIVDPAVVPTRPVFDTTVTYGAPAALTADGALDGISHALEVLYGAAGQPSYAQIEAVARECIRLVVQYLPRVLQHPRDAEAREALRLATDLGAYAIMLGGTNGGHLTSFSLVDILSHGRACAITNPYYTVFFAPAIQQPLQTVGRIYRDAGFTDADIERLSGRELGVAVAEAMIAFERAIGFPTRLSEVPGFTQGHIERALAAAKDPQLRMKLENMPVPLTAEMVDEYMGSVLLAARDGDLGVIQNV
ncbi:MAG: iron-containing alcohol dehydrogenase [Anaerolineales bacterium]|nr:iron-containing alcohol dehydrogenase [Anaerolineales bacterium]